MFCKKNALILHFFHKTFGHIRKKQYLCSRFRNYRKVFLKICDLRRMPRWRNR